MVKHLGQRRRDDPGIDAVRAAGQHDRHPRAERDACRRRAGQVDQLLGNHVAAFEIGRHQDVGPLAVESLSGMHADVAVMSAGGITLDGITNSHALLIDIQRAMLESAQRIIFCLDHTKFNRRSVSPLCELDAIDTNWM